jgi:hypothetical protein
MEAFTLETVLQDTKNPPRIVRHSLIGPSCNVYNPLNHRGLSLHLGPLHLLKHLPVYILAMAEQSWSNNPYAPQIPYLLYFAEKVTLAGILLGAIFYGTSIYTPVYLRSPFRLVHRSRDHDRPVLPMYECVALSRQSQKWGRPVGTRGPHHYHVRVCDSGGRVEPRPSIHFRRR